MSNQNNTDLLERGYELAERVLGTGHDKQIFQAIEDNDFKKLERLIKDVESQEELAWSEQFDEMTDERAEAMYAEAERRRDERRENGLTGANDVY